MLSFTAVGCPCVDDTINSSPWLRWKIFAMFGAGRLCGEMTKRGAPLRLADGAPVIGRFFPSACQSVTNDDRQTVTLQFSGDGYAWTPITKRMSFSNQATVEYKPDFNKDGGTIYVWFRPVNVTPPTFQVGSSDNRSSGLDGDRSAPGQPVRAADVSSEPAVASPSFTIMATTSRWGS